MYAKPYAPDLDVFPEILAVPTFGGLWQSQPDVQSGHRLRYMAAANAA